MRKKSKRFGVNLIGNIRSTGNQGICFRHLVKVIRKTKIPLSLVNTPNLANNCSKLISRMKYSINIFVITPPELLSVKAVLSCKTQHQYNIVALHWGYSSFPEEYRNSLSCFDKIWVFCKCDEYLFKSLTDIPVLRFYPREEITRSMKLSRKQLSLPENSDLFLTIYDEKKDYSISNVSAVIKAFRKAFRKEDRSACLVVKIINSNNDVRQKIEKELEDVNSIIIDSIYTEKQLNELVRLCNVLVSLEKSTPYNYKLAKAMLSHTAVIASNSQGNSDIISHITACCVDCRERTAQIEYDTVQFESEVFETDVIQTAVFMKLIRNDAHYRKSISDYAYYNITARTEASLTDCMITEEIMNLK